ncbi:type VI secretion system baseplate subunit TssK [Pseudomonas aeruginosa]|uniref:type VI secretion system baseplate subunit TssK n=1 Tax=Pseudomonas aeruginosa TaxID=287 RepID=UPI003891B3E8
MSVLPDAVCWHEGMQLLPQHFQLQGLRAEALAARTGQACNPWFWGVTALELDPSALCAGQVRVLHLEAILPDGLPVSVQAGVDAPLEFDLETALAAAEGPLLNVHLAVSPLWRAGQLLPLKGRLQSRVGAPLPDLASGEHPEPITVWRASLRLVGDDGKADSVCLPLLRVAKEGGAYVSLPYVPPTPLVLPESPLGRRVQSLCARAREKALFLGGRLRLAQQAGNQDDAVEVRRQLAALWTRLPEVEGLLASRAASPLALHGSLLGLAGAWAALDPLAGVPAFEALDFLDLRRGYEPLLDWLERAIESIRAGYRCLPFEQEEQVFSVRLPGPAPRQRLVVGLRMPAGAGEQAAADWLERAIVASDPHLPLLARQRMSGLARQPMNRQEQVAYSVGDDTRLFVVQGAGDWFDAGQPLRIVAPVCGVASSPWQIVLFVADGSDNT